MMNLIIRMLTALMVIAALLACVPGQSKRSKTGSRATKQDPALPPPGVPLVTATPFASPEGRFSIALPPDFEAFDQTSESHQTPYGETLTVVTYKAKAASGKDFREGLVIYIDYPQRIFREKGLFEILETAQRITLASLGKPTVLNEEYFLWSPDTHIRTPLSKGSPVNESLARARTLGVPGISLLASVPDGLGQTYMRSETFLIKPRAYVIALMYGNKAAFNRPAVKNFFDSFRVTQTASGKP